MIKDKALLPSPTPASKAGGGNELLLLFGFILSMATLFLAFAMLLIDRYFIKQKKLPEFDNKIGNKPKEKKRILPQKIERLEAFDNEVSDKLKQSDSEKQELLQKRSDRHYGAFFKSAECSQYMMLFQKHSESQPDKPLYTIAFYTSTLHDPGLKSAYTLSPCKSTEPPATKSTVRISFFDSNTQSAIKSRSPVRDSKENISLWDSPSAISGSQQKWMLSPSPISGGKQNTSQCTASGSEQASSEWLLSPIANVNEQDTPKWVLSHQGKSLNRSDLYSIDNPHSSVPIPTNTPFIIELKTTPIPSEEAIDDSRDSFSSPKFLS